MRKAYKISVTEEYVEVLEHIKRQKNSSRYILELVRKDMAGDESQELQEIRSIKKLLQSGELSLSSPVNEEIEASEDDFANLFSGF